MKYLRNYNSIFESNGEEIDEVAFARIRKSVLIITSSFGFFSDLLFKLKIKQTTKAEMSEIDTMATDGKSIIYNPEFTKRLTIPEIVFVLCHEILHNVFHHFTRMGDRNHEMWNYAGDYAINLLLKEMSEGNSNKIQMPEKVLYKTEYKNLSTEQIYDILEKEQQQMKNLLDKLREMAKDTGNDVRNGSSLDKSGVETIYKGEGGGNGDKAGKDDPNSPIKGGSSIEDAKSNDELKRIWQDAAREAALKNPGSMSGGMKRLFSQLTKPKVNWKAELRHFVASVYNKLDYININRRFVGYGSYIPGIKRHKSDYSDVVVAIDTSGSIGEKQLTAFASELIQIFKEKNIERCHVIWCDSDIPKDGIQTFSPKNFKLEKLKPVGGDGTSFKPPFEWVKTNLIKKGIEPAFMIYFTDAYGDAPNKNQVPFHDRVMWVICENDNPSNITFGKKLLLPLE